jgi:hypothetical protein
MCLAPEPPFRAVLLRLTLFYDEEGRGRGRCSPLKLLNGATVLRRRIMSTTPASRSSAARMTRHRERRRQGTRCVTVDVSQRFVDDEKKLPLCKYRIEQKRFLPVLADFGAAPRTCSFRPRSSCIGFFGVLLPMPRTRVALSLSRVTRFTQRP